MKRLSPPRRFLLHTLATQYTTEGKIMTGGNALVGMEALENRRLLSGVMGADTSHLEPPIIIKGGVQYHLTTRGTLVVSGTNAADRIVMSRIDGKFVLQATDGVYVTHEGFSASKVKRIRIEAMGGDDVVRIDAHGHSTGGIVQMPQPEFDRRVTIAGGAGNDTLVGSAGDTLIGGGGNDRLVAQQLPAQVVEGDPAWTWVGKHFVVLPQSPAEGPAVLTGGAGRDTLVAGGNDTVVGGAGDDLAIYLRFVYTGGEQVDIVPGPFARDAFGSRASGIEHFDTFTEEIPQIVADG